MHLRFFQFLRKFMFLDFRPTGRQKLKCFAETEKIEPIDPTEPTEPTDPTEHFAEFSSDFP